jgi:hypothetical protein
MHVAAQSCDGRHGTRCGLPWPKSQLPPTGDLARALSDRTRGIGGTDHVPGAYSPNIVKIAGKWRKRLPVLSDRKRKPQARGL